MSEDIKLDEPTSNDSLSEQNGKQVDPKNEDWASLSGSSQERFQQLANKRKEAEEQALKLKEENEKLRKEMEEKIANMQSSQPKEKVNPSIDEQMAFARLRNLGVATKDDYKSEIEKLRQEMQAQKDREALNSKHEQLKNKYSSEGLPEYNPEEIEEYMRKEGIYNPEAAYRNKYFDELKNNSTSPQHQGALQTKSKIDETNVWTPERLAERLRKPDAKEFYLKNQSKIERLQEKWRQEAE